MTQTMLLIKTHCKIFGPGYTRLVLETFAGSANVPQWSYEQREQVEIFLLEKIYNLAGRSSS